jgi:rubredoxin
MRKYRCAYCAHVYDESLGDPDSGIAPGTRYEDIPDDWLCPECGAGKSDYLLIED